MTHLVTVADTANTWWRLVSYLVAVLKAVLFNSSSTSESSSHLLQLRQERQSVLSPSCLAELTVRMLTVIRELSALKQKYPLILWISFPCPPLSFGAVTTRKPCPLPWILIPFPSELGQYSQVMKHFSFGHHRDPKCWTTKLSSGSVLHSHSSCSF